MNMKLGCKWECKLKNKTTTKKNPIGVAIVRVVIILMLVQALPKHGSSSPITLKGFCFKHERAFEL